MWLLIILLAILGCGGAKKNEQASIDVPYPADEDMLYYQAESDSGHQQFWTDIKATASAFINNSSYANRGIRFEDIRIVGEGIYNGKVEVDLGKGVLELTLLRKFQSRGKNAIWQVIGAKESKWPKSDSK
jgi:hypothetical protein